MVSTHLKHISQLGSFSQVGVNIKKHEITTQSFTSQMVHKISWNLNGTTIEMMIELTTRPWQKKSWSKSGRILPQKHCPLKPHTLSPIIMVQWKIGAWKMTLVSKGAIFHSHDCGRRIGIHAPLAKKKTDPSNKPLSHCNGWFTRDFP